MKTLKILLLFQVFAIACNAQMYRDYEMRDSLNYPLSIYYLKPINDLPQVLTMSNTFLDKSVSLVRLDGANVIYDKYFHPHNDSLIIVNSQGSTGIRPLCHIDNPKDSSYFIAFNLKDDYQFVTEVAMVMKMKYDGDTVWTQKHPGSQIQDIILMQDSILIWGGTGITSVNAITGEYIDSGFSPTSANTFQQVFYQIEHGSTDSTLFFVGARTPFGGWRQGLFGLMSYNGIYLWTKTYSLNNRAPFFKKMQKTSTVNFYLMNHVEDSIGSNFTNITYVD